MNELEAKIQALSLEIASRKEKAISRARTMAVVYGVLVIIVFCYTLYVARYIQQMATPETVSSMLTSQVSAFIPDIHAKLSGYVEKEAPAMTQKIIDMAHEQVPEIEKKVQTFVDEQTTFFISDVRKELMPDFVEVLKSHSKEISENSKVLTDEVAAQELVKTITGELDKEINYNILGDEFFGKFHELRKELDTLATKPVNEMSRKQLAERNAIVNWYHIIKSGQSINSVLGCYLSSVGFTFQSLTDGTFFLEGTKPGEIIEMEAQEEGKVE